MDDELTNVVAEAMADIRALVVWGILNMSGADKLLETRTIGTQRAVSAGAKESTVRVVDVEDLPLAYMPGNAVRARVRVVGDIGD